MKYEAVIGLEVHAQLRTATKIFCGCPNRFGDTPNTNVCPVCLGLPGTLPVLNRRVIDMALMVMAATGCRIRNTSIFARKNYFYPDLPKGYQISQYEAPLAEHGVLPVNIEGDTKQIGITRIHLEEDAGKSMHDAKENVSLVDLNRCGTPLIEIVSEPDMRTPEQGAAYLRTLRQLLVYLGVCDGNMEQGSFRCDANISIRPVGQKTLGTRTELKNMNSFKNVQSALSFEVERQIGVLAAHGTIHQETLLWDAQRQVTLVMRSKEEAHDYRYFPEPDLLPLQVDETWIENVRTGLTELPWEKRKRFIDQYGILEADADLLTTSRETADFFEAVAAASEPKTAGNWIMVELQGKLNAAGLNIGNSPVGPQALADLLNLVADKTISGKMAKDVFAEMFVSGRSATDIVDERGLLQVSDASTIEAWVEEIIENSPAQVQQFLDGKEAVLGHFMGQIMKKSKGKANPQLAQKALREKLADRRDKR